MLMQDVTNSHGTPALKSLEREIAGMTHSHCGGGFAIDEFTVDYITPQNIELCWKCL